MAMLNLRLSDKDHAAIKRHADAEGKTVSKFCREVLLDKAEYGVILREPLEKEMIELREKVNERILDMVNICDSLAHGVVDKEKSQDKAIKEMRRYFEKQCAILNERVEYQNKLTRELFKLILYDVKLIGYFNRNIIEKGLENHELTEACEHAAEVDAGKRIKELHIG